jgi:NADPH-dependent curcumin reductase CurA
MNKQILLAHRPEGLPTTADFRIEELPVPRPKEGELLLRILFLSLTPICAGS